MGTSEVTPGGATSGDRGGEPEPPPPPPGRSLAREAVAIGVVATALAAACLIPNACGSYHDDGIYLATAKALAEGDGYRLVNLPGAPIQTKYPIGYPLLLAACWRAWPAFPANLVLLHAVTLLAAGMAVGLAYAYLVRFGHASRFAAGLGCLLCATSPTFAYFAGRLLSEMPFALLLVVALWAFDDLLRSPRPSRRRCVGAGLVMAAPLLCRSIAIAPLVVFGLACARRRPLRWALPGMVAVALPWLAWTLINRGEAARNPVLGYYTDYVGWWASASPWSAAGFLALNAYNLVTSIPLVVFGPAAFARLPGRSGAVVQAILGFVPLAVLARGRGGLRPALAAYLALAWAWPWPPFRFEVPIGPILAAAMLDRAVEAGRRLPRRAVVALGVALFVGSIAANLAELARYRRITRSIGYPTLAAEARPGAWPRFERLLAWICARAEPDAVIASNLDTMIYLYTGRTAFRPYAGRPLEQYYGQGGSGAGTVDEFERALRTLGARYLARLPVEGRELDHLIAAARRRYPGLLRPAYADGGGEFLIYEITPRPSP